MQIKTFFDPNTFTISHIIIDETTKNCAIIDSVMDYDMFSGRISHQSADNLLTFVKENNLQVEWILETHIHADHLTAATYIKEQLSTAQTIITKIAIGEGISEVLKYWVKIFNIGDEVATDGSQFDHIFKDQETFKIGNLEAKFLTTPGHTPACGSYLIGDSVFVGDLMFMPNLGTGRADFPGGNAAQEFDSIQKIFALPPKTKIFTCHDYPKNNEPAKWQSTVEEQKQENILAQLTNQADYIKARETKDKNLPVPKLLLPALQINLRVGKLPKPENDKQGNRGQENIGLSYIKIPLNLL
jgi:glyoxylase-like metal-dependent hydrolase (beta-lactamase superfamily II)